MAKAFTAKHKNPLVALDQFLEVRLAKVAPNTVARDVGHLKWLMPRMLPASDANPMLGLLEDIQRAVRRADPTKPVTKALPMSATALRSFLVGKPLAIRAIAHLAFRTASRVDDVVRLRPCDVTMTPHGLLVCFKTTKPNQEGKSRADHRIVVPDPHPDILLHLRSQSRSKTLFQKQHKHQLRALLWQHPPPLGEVEKWQAQDPQNRVRSRYTLHSFKRGAAAIAWQAVVDRKISLQDLLLLLKHQDVATALEYCPCPLTAARAAGTSAAALTAI